MRQSDMDTYRNEMAKTQRAMERGMLGIILTDRKINDLIKSTAKIHDVKQQIATLKRSYASHNA